MKILAIDPATKLGWCSFGNHSGTLNYTLRSKESQGMKFVKFRKDLIDIITGLEIDLVVYEKPGGRHYNGIRSCANFEGVILEACESMKVDYRDYSPTEIKKFAKESWQAKIGGRHKGQMNKEKMLKYGRAVFNKEFIDDNHCDATWLYYLANKEFN